MGILILRPIVIGPLLAGLAALMALVACDKKEPGREIGPGSLVCPDTASPAGPKPGTFSGQCPLLVVEVDKDKGMVRAIGPSDHEERLPLSAVKKSGDARLPGKLAGATASPIERMAPGPNPGVLTPQSDFGLIFKGGGAESDTVFPDELPALQAFYEKGQGEKAQDLDACLDALLRSPSYGFLRAPFAPVVNCGIASAPAWSERGDSGASASPWLIGDSGFNLRAMAKPGPGIAPERNWIFLATDDRHWIWRMKRGDARILTVPFMENAAIENVSAAEMDGDSIPEIILEAGTDYGDGFYSSLYVLRGHADSGVPRIGSLDLGGASGEADGATVESEWWIKIPYLYHAYAQAGNARGRGEGHDIRIDAYRFSDRGAFAKDKRATPAAVFFGPLAAKESSRSWRDSLLLRRPELRDSGLRVLPRRTSSGIQWQTGAIAPDSPTAAKWAGWDETGSILTLPASD